MDIHSETNIHTCIHADTQIYMQTDIHTGMHTYIQIDRHTYQDNRET